MNLKEITFVGIFAALAVVVGYLLAPVPNIEFFTATIFLSGLLLGKKNGLLVGVIASLIFGLYNPWGPSPTPLLIAQVSTRGFIGYAGGLFGVFDWDKRPAWLHFLSFGLAGFFLTSLYNVAAALSFVIPAGLTFEKFAAEMIAGFFLISLATFSNVAIFAILIPIVFAALKKSTVLQLRSNN